LRGRIEDPYIFASPQLIKTTRKLKRIILRTTYINVRANNLQQSSEITQFDSQMFVYKFHVIELLAMEFLISIQYVCMIEGCSPSFA
jgi:hypothetical protein